MKPERKTLDSWRDLEDYGIIYLTREACGTGQRVLCDLTPEGLDFIQGFFSIEMKPGTNVNYSQGQIASIMLPVSLYIELLIYALLRENYEIVVHVVGSGRFRGNNVHGMSRAEWEKQRETWNTAYNGDFRVCSRSTAPGTGLLNRHAMSGRIG